MKTTLLGAVAGMLVGLVVGTTLDLTDRYVPLGRGIYNLPVIQDRFTGQLYEVFNTELIAIKSTPDQPVTANKEETLHKVGEWFNKQIEEADKDQ